MTIPMKNTEADQAVSDAAHDAAANELRSFVERFEQLETEKKDIADQQAELKAEVKGRGYDIGAFNRVLARRKLDSDKRAEMDALDEMYREALGV